VGRRGEEKEGLVQEGGKKKGKCFSCLSQKDASRQLRETKRGHRALSSRKKKKREGKSRDFGREKKKALVPTRKKEDVCQDHATEKKRGKEGDQISFPKEKGSPYIPNQVDEKKRSSQIVWPSGKKEGDSYGGKLKRKKNKQKPWVKQKNRNEKKKWDVRI